LLPLIEAPYLSKIILITTSGMFLSQIVFFSIGVMSAAIFRKNIFGQVLIYGFLLSTYILSILIQYFQTIDFLNFLTPFQYFQVNEVSQFGLSLKFIILAISATSVLLFLSIKIFKTKDLYV
jgi:ABC-2 type transport system permease protein